jgi:hypothetical protein
MFEMIPSWVESIVSVIFIALMMWGFISQFKSTD